MIQLNRIPSTSVDTMNTESEYKCESCGRVFTARHYGELTELSSLECCGKTATWQRNIGLVINAHMVQKKMEEEEYPYEQR